VSFLQDTDDNGTSVSLSPGLGDAGTDNLVVGWCFPYNYAVIEVETACEIGSAPLTVNAPPPPTTLVSKIQYYLNGAWMDVPPGGLSSICQGSSIIFQAVPAAGAWPPNQPVWGGDAMGQTGAIASVTFASSGTRTISATSLDMDTVYASVAVTASFTAVPITWQAASVTVTSATGTCTTNYQQFSPTYQVCADVGNNVWRLGVAEIQGGVDIAILTGGYRNPDTNPPATQAEAQDAVSVMKAYYTLGKGTWHTPAASTAHENYHYTEWQCSSANYWGATQTALQALTAAYTSYATPAAAIAAIGAAADKKMTAFTNIAVQYWQTLSDIPPSRPYAAGQLALNPSIITVQNLAAQKGWTVPQGTDSPSTADPCYQPWLPYSP
jgi:hypothetical protein